MDLIDVELADELHLLGKLIEAANGCEARLSRGQIDRLLAAEPS
ncbi:MAG TPA: hypothetical protein VI452_06535 [Marmoricola sp.]